MKKLLLLSLTILLFSCGDNNDSFLDEVKSSVYKETGTATFSGASGDIIYNFTNYFTFKLDTYAYTMNGVNDGPRSSDCYSTFNQYYGTITSEDSQGITYLSDGTTFRIVRQSGGIRISWITDSSTVSLNLANSSPSELDNAIAGLRSSNTCD
jgi:hypothetical protein